MAPNTGTRIQNRQALTIVNGGQDLPPLSGPPSNSGSDCGAAEFSKDDVEILLNEKLKKTLNYRVCFSELSKEKFRAWISMGFICDSTFDVSAGKE